MQVVAGGYEGTIFGWEVTMLQRRGEGGVRVHDTLRFAEAAHVGSVKSVAISRGRGRYLAGGGDDERVSLFNLHANKTLGELGQQEGSITALEFFRDSHLLTASADGSICIWRVHDWRLLHVLGGHRGQVNDLTVHPTGRIALSCGQDRTLRLWNLVDGRVAFIHRVKDETPPRSVQWCADGQWYFLCCERNLYVYRTEDNECLCTIQHPTPVHCTAFLPNGQVATSCEDKVLRIYTVRGEPVAQIDMEVAGVGRIKAMQAARAPVAIVDGETLSQRTASRTRGEAADAAEQGHEQRQEKEEEQEREQDESGEQEEHDRNGRFTQGVQRRKRRQRSGEKVGKGEDARHESESADTGPSIGELPVLVTVTSDGSMAIWHTPSLLRLGEGPDSASIAGCRLVSTTLPASPRLSHLAVWSSFQNTSDAAADETHEEQEAGQRQQEGRAPRLQSQSKKMCESRKGASAGDGARRVARKAKRARDRREPGPVSSTPSEGGNEEAGVAEADEEKIQGHAADDFSRSRSRSRNSGRKRARVSATTSQASKAAQSQTPHRQQPQRQGKQSMAGKLKTSKGNRKNSRS